MLVLVGVAKQGTHQFCKLAIVGSTPTSGSIRCPKAPGIRYIAQLGSSKLQRSWSGHNAV